ncbi:ABC transporter permease [Candidatus Bipolaricaulota bacterium]|nr:ABC transporter permease [Candidatus Bipolaricaulota bacterium]
MLALIRGYGTNKGEKIEMAQEKTPFEFSRRWDGYKRRSHRRIKKLAQILQAIRREPRGLIGASIMAIILICALFAPWIAPFDPYEQDIPDRFARPSSKHLLGTDYIGRDILSRIIYGARVAAVVSIGSVGIAVIVGVLLGAIAAYKGGAVDYMILLIFDAIRSFPSIILILVLVAVLGSSIINVVFVLAFTLFPSYGRITRAQTLSVKEEEYTEAAKSLGAKTSRIILNHILPNVLAPIIVTGGMDLASMIMWESGLSFLGLGVRPPTASWGVMLRQGYTYMLTSPWMIVWPSIALATTMLGCSLFAEGLRIALNPKEREAGG